MVKKALTSAEEAIRRAECSKQILCFISKEPLKEGFFSVKHESGVVSINPEFAK